MIQKYFNEITIDNGEPDCIQIWQDDQEGSNIIFIARENLDKLIELLQGLNRITTDHRFKCEDCGEKGYRNPEQVHLMNKNNEYGTNVVRWLCSPCTIKRYPQTSEFLKP